MLFQNSLYKPVYAIFIFSLPLIGFLNKINLPQINFLHLIELVLSQLFLLIFIFFFTLIINKFLKNFVSIKFIDFFILNSFIIYLLFYYKKILILFKYFDKYFLIDNFIVFTIYSLIYFFILKIIKFNKKLFYKFVLIYIFLNFLVFFYNSFDLLKQKFTPSSNNYNKNLKYKSIDLNELKKSENKSDIFIIIFDSMIDINLAEKNNIISDKSKLLNDLKINGFKYNKNYRSNYITTYLSIASILNSAYPHLPEDGRYYDRSNLFPDMISSDKKKNNFYKILDNTDRKFIWYGNDWAKCKQNNKVVCYYKKFNFLNNLKQFYSDSIFSYFFDYYQNDDLEALKFLTNISFYQDSKKKFKDNNLIYLIHIMSPHIPYIFDKKCNITQINSTEPIYYSYAYNCLIKILIKWQKELIKINDNNIVIVVGDHGWSKEETNRKFLYTKKYLESRFSSFFAYNFPDRCNNINVANSGVNIMRMILNCAENLNLNFLDDRHLISFAEDNIDFGILKNYYFNK